MTTARFAGSKNIHFPAAAAAGAFSIFNHSLCMLLSLSLFLIPNLSRVLVGQIPAETWKYPPMIFPKAYSPSIPLSYNLPPFSFPLYVYDLEHN